MNDEERGVIYFRNIRGKLGDTIQINGHNYIIVGKTEPIKEPARHVVLIGDWSALNDNRTQMGYAEQMDFYDKTNLRAYLRGINKRSVD